jgi:MoaA/NifB/PqqE/SkfB family radical SAM enzyme
MNKHAYRVVVNWEWTSKCNARCAMCPRHAITQPTVSQADNFEHTLARLHPDDVFRCVIAGYGEPTSHPQFDSFIQRLRGHPVPFDMATNGSLLSAARLRALDGVLRTLMISFSSVDPQVYQSVHTNLDQDAVMRNILAAKRVLRNTRLVINLSPTHECLDTLDSTVSWLRSNGVNDLHMSPTYYDRAGAQQTGGQPDTERLRSEIRRHNLGSQETAFIPGASEIFQQWRANRVKCLPRNTNMLIAATGDYTYCFNDISESHSLGHVSEISLRQAIQRREAMEEEGRLCGQCNLRSRYGPKEITRVAVTYLKAQLAGRRPAAMA